MATITPPTTRKKLAISVAAQVSSDEQDAYPSRKLPCLKLNILLSSEFVEQLLKTAKDHKTSAVVQKSISNPKMDILLEIVDFDKTPASLTRYYEKITDESLHALTITIP